MAADMMGRIMLDRVDHATARRIGRDKNKQVLADGRRDEK
jgi:hypothetical protein